MYIGCEMHTDNFWVFYGGFHYQTCSAIDSFSPQWNSFTSILNFVIMFLAKKDKDGFL
jgi:hypothetical protein